MIVELPTIKPAVPQLNEYCYDCPRLTQSRSKPTWGYGDGSSHVMLVGEAPGQHGCDRTGIPFYGDRSGFFLQQTLRRVGIDFTKLYTTNIVKCCPPNNDTPTSREVENCTKYLDTEVKTMKPLCIIAVGKVALNALLLKPVPSIISISGRPMMGKSPYAPMIIPMLHPAFILRNMDKAAAYQRQWELLVPIIETFTKSMVRL